MSFLIKTFEVDITPTNNQFPLLASPGQTSIETPIYLRGFILSSGSSKWLVSTIELCVIAGSYYSELLEAISLGADVPQSHCTLHASHQHDVPFFDEMFHGTMQKYGKPMFAQKDWEELLEKIKKEIKKCSQKEGKRVSQVSFDKSEVVEYASDRRIYQDGKMNWRSTKCQKPELKALPLGEIDPHLYQTILWGENKKPIITLNFYASHPQVADGRGLLSSDAPGFALKKMRELLPMADHLYFDGCGADIGNGKFAGPSKDADIPIFGTKLFNAMQYAFEKSAPEPLTDVNWKNHLFDMPIKKSNDNLDELVVQIKDADFINNPRKLSIARNIGLIERKKSTYPFRISVLKLNKNQIIFFPAEMFLTYQKYCLEKFSGKTCVAAYGDGFLGYVPEDSDFALGGYEIEGAFQLLSPGCEKLIKSEIDKLVKTPI